MYFLLMCSKIINYTKKNEKKLLEGDLNITLTSILLRNISDNYADNLLNKKLKMYHGSRKGFTFEKYKSGDYNYDEKEFKLSPDSCDFVNNKNIDFLYYEKEVSEPKSDDSEGIPRGLDEFMGSIDRSALFNVRGSSNRSFTTTIDSEPNNNE